MKHGLGFPDERSAADTNYVAGQTGGKGCCPTTTKLGFI